MDIDTAGKQGGLWLVGSKIKVSVPACQLTDRPALEGRRGRLQTHFSSSLLSAYYYYYIILLYMRKPMQIRKITDQSLGAGRCPVLVDSTEQPGVQHNIFPFSGSGSCITSSRKPITRIFSSVFSSKSWGPTQQQQCHHTSVGFFLLKRHRATETRKGGKWAVPASVWRPSDAAHSGLCLWQLFW